MSLGFIERFRFGGRVGKRRVMEPDIGRCRYGICIHRRIYDKLFIQVSCRWWVQDVEFETIVVLKCRLYISFFFLQCGSAPPSAAVAKNKKNEWIDMLLYSQRLCLNSTALSP